MGTRLRLSSFWGVVLFYLLKARDQQAPLCPDQITVASCWQCGGRRPDPRFPRALRGSEVSPTASHGSPPRLPVRAAASFAYVAVTGDVLSLSLWEECRSNYAGGPETRLRAGVCVLEVCVRRRRSVCALRGWGPKGEGVGEVKGELYVASRVPVFMKTHLPRAPA